MKCPQHECHFVKHIPMTFEEQIEHAKKMAILTPHQCMQKGLYPVHFYDDGTREHWVKSKKLTWDQLSDKEKEEVIRIKEVPCICERKNELE